MSDDEFEVKSQTSEDDDEDYDNNSATTIDDEVMDSDDEENNLEELYVDDDETEQSNDLEQIDNFYLYDYKQKFTSNLRKDYIEKIHPEEVHITFDEMNKLSIIKRDENGIIIDSLHRTYPILSKYEKTKIIGIRVSQLNKGAIPYIKLKLNPKVLDNSLIAEKELLEKRLPFIIRRPIPNGYFEYWNINDLELIH
jgi:DNA-directed RNA polymerase I, II, and III subunit RPABC2